MAGVGEIRGEVREHELELEFEFEVALRDAGGHEEFGLVDRSDVGDTEFAGALRKSQGKIAALLDVGIAHVHPHCCDRHWMGLPEADGFGEESGDDRRAEIDRRAGDDRRWTEVRKSHEFIEHLCVGERQESFGRKRAALNP